MQYGPFSIGLIALCILLLKLKTVLLCYLLQRELREDELSLGGQYFIEFVPRKESQSPSFSCITPSLHQNRTVYNETGAFQKTLDDLEKCERILQQNKDKLLAKQLTAFIGELQAHITERLRRKRFGRLKVAFSTHFGGLKQLNTILQKIEVYNA